jgi:hypothetical protein
MLSTHDIFGSRPPTSRKRKSLCSGSPWWSKYSVSSAQFSASATRFAGCDARRWVQMQQYAVRPRANGLILCGTKEKGVHGCLVASLKADVLVEESVGPPAMGTQPEGTAPGRKPWDSSGSFPRGETTTAQRTGQYRLEPVPGRKPGIVRALYCLACLFVLNRCTTLITYFGAGGRCWWPGCLFPTPLFPSPP